MPTDPRIAGGGADATPQPKIARTVAEAQVGDLLWVCEDRWRADAWRLWPVRKVGRLYIYVGPTEHEHLWLKTAREHPYDANRAVMGWQQREAAHYQGMTDEVVRRMQIADLDTLKTIAFALGLDPAPDFSIVPPEEPRHG